MTLGGTLLGLAGVLWVVSFLGVLVILWKSITAYRQHESRPMLYLAIGLVFLLILAPLLDLAAEFVADELFFFGFMPGEQPIISTLGLVYLSKELLRLVGIIALLASLYVGEHPTSG